MTCARCGVDFVARFTGGAQQKYCSPKCQVRRRSAPPGQTNASCTICGSAFRKRSHNKHVVCSRKCYQRLHYVRRRGWAQAVRACKNCGADFQTKDEKQRFCKAECYRLYGYKRMKVYKGRAPSVAQYDQMLENAAGKCAICQQPCERLVLDHCHSTAVARGLLCSNCNSGLGMFGDSIERLTAAIAYLRHFEERVA